MRTRVLSIENGELFTSAAEEAARLLKNGEVVALPTETVYGLAANALEAKAVKAIYEIKGRPSHNPIIVHVSSMEMARRCVSSWPERAEVLARHFWPGALTLVLPRSNEIPDVVTAGGLTVGVRFPMHPFMRTVIGKCDFPLAAPSANRANHLSPTTAEHVMEGLSGRIPLIVDGGPTSVGIESTVLDLSRDAPSILRPGMISARQISTVLGVAVKARAAEIGVLKSPGMLERHYAPRAKVLVWEWDNDADLVELVNKSGVAMGAVHVIAHERIPLANPFGRVAIIPQDAEAYARAIYAEMHRSDELGAELILVEAPPAGEDWEGIRDRLRRASA